MPYLGVGWGRDGGMAEYVVVPARNLVPLGDADPVAAAPLADAGSPPKRGQCQLLLNLTAKDALWVGSMAGDHTFTSGRYSSVVSSRDAVVGSLSFGRMRRRVILRPSIASTVRS